VSAWRVAALAALVAGNLWLHLPISDFFDGIARRYGFVEYDTATRAVFFAAGLGALAWLWTGPAEVRSASRRALAVLLVLIGVAHALLVVNGIEAIHYPQYALLAWIIAGAGWNAEKTWAATTALGAVDEAWQWQMLPRAQPGYFDWNDVVLNAIGAALGVMVVARLSRRRHSGRWPSRPVLAFAMAALLLAIIWGPFITTPFYRTTPGGRWFHLLSPAEGVLWLATVGAVVRSLATPARRS
jgi:hypothetical protein